MLDAGDTSRFGSGVSFVIRQVDLGALPVGHLELGRDPRPDQRPPLVADNNVNQCDTGVDLGTCTRASSGRPVPTFTKIAFTDATVNRNRPGFDSPTQYNTMNVVDVLIRAGALTTSGAGSSYWDTFEHAS